MNILIVDDEEEVGLFVKMRLGRDAPHFSIATADSAADCLDHIKNHRVDCILSDYQMPGMNGMELLKRLKEQGTETPFIFLTGQGNEEVAREAFKNGAYDYFTKEIGFAHYARIINSIEQAVRHGMAQQEKKKTEDAFLFEKNKLEAVLASIGDGISIQNSDFRVIYQNRAHRNIVGDHIGEHCYKAYQHRNTVCESCALDMSMKDGKVHTVQKSAVGDRGLFHVEITASPIRDASGKIAGGVESVRDITDRVLALEALKESEAQFRGLVEESLVGVYIIQDGRLVYSNPRHAEMFGYTQEELLYKPVEDIIYPEDREILVENLRKRISGEVNSMNYTFRASRKDGSVLNVEVYGTRTTYKGRPAIIGSIIERPAGKPAN